MISNRNDELGRHIDGIEMSVGPTVSIVIPHYQDLGGLERCLRALAQQTYPADDFEIIVADNNSPVGKAAVGAVVNGRAKVVVVTEKGAGPARNGGVAIATGAIVAFTDSDCCPEPTWLEEGLRALPAYDFIGGRVTVLVDDIDAMTATEAFERVFAFDFETYITRKGFTGAGNLFCSRAVFERVGEFRQGVSEDIEWSYRARGIGLRLGYAPKAIVGHPARRSWAELKVKWQRVNAERYKLACERRGGRILWMARSLALPLSALAHVPRVMLSDQLSSWKQRRMAIGMLFQVRMWRLIDSVRLLLARSEY